MKRVRIPKAGRALWLVVAAAGSILLAAAPALAVPVGPGGGGPPAGGTSGITTEVPRVVEVTGDAYWVALAITAAIAVAAIGLLLAGYLRNRKPAI